MFFSQSPKQGLTVRVEYQLDTWEVAEAIDEAIRRGMIPADNFDNSTMLIDGITLLYRATGGQKTWRGAKAETLERARRMLSQIHYSGGDR